MAQKLNNFCTNDVLHRIIVGPENLKLLKPQTKKFIFGPFWGAHSPQNGALNQGFGKSGFIRIVWWPFYIDR